jgi:hypothetical protein
MKFLAGQAEDKGFPDRKQIEAQKKATVSGPE